ncbi:hypothetical protein GPECTOR_2g1109 [Gonium pectorale]|uniref:Uncharacterized protein n=1 Tax=Gonium pectorale TaxID=33097 RepID=A0A150H1U9_GONPE|nr:hypothetical protein GPECTOR_2g1109 [Gonium pectorale]|eukprot:KXZ55560.1 hypothetical protein GPECTOR_2g1109 [Gonium pectorale]
MGLLRFVLAQTAISALVIGALKEKGAVQLKPEAVQNEYARFAITYLVSLGESAWIKGQQLVEGLSQKPQ